MVPSKLNMQPKPFRVDSMMLNDSMPTLTAIHNQSVIEDSDENLGDHQFQKKKES
jgi:hypothetical protein